METETRSPPPTLVDLIRRAGGISTTARSLNLHYVTVHGWARGTHRPTDVNLARLQLLARTTPPRLAQSLRPPRPRRSRPSTEQVELAREAIRRAGGRTTVARALGVSAASVRSWDLGKSSPAGDRLQRLVSLPEGVPLRPGPPRRRRLADPSLIDQVVDRAGNQCAAARALGINRSTVRCYVRRQRELSAAVVERAREFLAANGVTLAPVEQPPS